MANVHTLPDEILLMLFTFLPLKSLISSRGVCKLWRSLIPSASLNSSRRRLLHFFLRAVHQDNRTIPFPDKIQHNIISRQLHNFDRSTYLQRLPIGLPSDFETWIFEWPIKAVIGGIWPGLKYPVRYHHRPQNCLETIVEAEHLVEVVLVSPDADAETVQAASTPLTHVLKIGGAFSMLDEGGSANSLQVVSVKMLKVAFVPQLAYMFGCIQEGCSWYLVVDVKTEAAKGLHGSVLSVLNDLRSASIVARSWVDFLGSELVERSY
ncbi:hypothetical protein ABKN59_008354 [Abortiporus biennis]